MPSLADTIKGHVRSQGGRCTVSLLIPNLEKAQLRDLNECLANPAIPATAIRQGLDEHGHKVGLSAIQRHRRGQCGCAR